MEITRRSKILVKAAKEFNVSTYNIVDFLTGKGYEIEHRPTTKLTQEMYSLLKKEFELSRDIKEKSDQLIVGTNQGIMQDATQGDLEVYDWEILPPGLGNWNEIKKTVAPNVKKYNRSLEKRKMVFENIRFLRRFDPGLSAMGKKGFGGYIVIGFPEKQLYILESFIWGNATYVFGEDWKELSKLNKQEVRRKKLHKKRIFHKSNWRKNIEDLMK